MIQLSEHFVAEEFVCKCGKCDLSNPVVIKEKINYKLIDKLEQLRMAINMPIIITSSARCKNKHIRIYQERYGEFWESHIVWGSFHLLGNNDKINACDFVCNYDRFKTIMYAAYFRFSGIGRYYKKLPETLRDLFIHVDVGDGARFYEKVYY